MVSVRCASPPDRAQPAATRYSDAAPVVGFLDRPPGDEAGEPQDACAHVCVVDGDEKVLLDTLVRPDLPVADYRTEFTGARCRHVNASRPEASRLLLDSEAAAPTCFVHAAGLSEGSLDGAPSLAEVAARLQRILSGAEAVSTRKLSTPPLLPRRPSPPSPVIALSL